MNKKPEIKLVLKLSLPIIALISIIIMILYIFKPEIMSFEISFLVFGIATIVFFLSSSWSTISETEEVEYWVVLSLIPTIILGIIGLTKYGVNVLTKWWQGLPWYEQIIAIVTVITFFIMLLLILTENDERRGY